MMPRTTGRAISLVTRAGGAGQAEQQPDDTGRKAGAPHHRWRNDDGLGGLCRGDRAGRFHGLHRHRGAIDEPADDHGQPESQQHAEGVHLENADVSDDEGNERTEIAKGSGDLHAVVAIGDWC